MREIDTEHNWFWRQGYNDGLDGRRAIAPDETRCSHQRRDYFAGINAGREERADRALQTEGELELSFDEATLDLR